MKLLIAGLLALACVGSGCRTAATGLIADALSGPSSLGADDDPELVRDAAPFGLKTMETLAVSQPKHLGLMTSLASGFAQYAYAFVQQEADVDEIEGRSSAARPKRERAKKLLLRARGYGLQGLDAVVPGVSDKLRTMQGVPEALAGFEKQHVPLLYWTAASWALAISNAKEDMGLVAELPAPGALVQRCLELDPSWENGALHEFQVSYLSAKPGATDAQVKASFDAAQKLNNGDHLGVLVSYAESVLVQNQQRIEFVTLMQRVISIDVTTIPEGRLANTIAQRRAALLLKHLDDLFN